MVKRQRVSSCLLRLGRHHPGKKTWGRAHFNWLANQRLESREQRLAFEEMLLGVRQESERVERLEQAIREAITDWDLLPVVTALQAMRGIDLIAAVTIMTEIGDLTRFSGPRELMGYLGLTPSERSTGDTVRRGGITKAGNSRTRPPRVSREKQVKVEVAPRAVREIAWKAQTRLTGRYRALSRAGKRSTIVVTAVARELAGFIWATGREVAASA